MGRSDEKTFVLNLGGLDHREAGELTKRLRAARQRFPEGSEERRSWEAIGELTPRDASGWWKRLKDPLKVRGRPRKPWPQRRDAELLSEMEKLVSGGIPKTTAARQVLEAQGITATKSLKPRTDNLVRLFNKRSAAL